MFDRLFTEHPRQAGESYLTHMRTALGFSGAMFLGALACLVHAFVPGLCVKTGSETIRRLNSRMAPRAERCEAARATAKATASRHGA